MNPPRPRRLRIPIDWLVFLLPPFCVGLMVSGGVLAMKVLDLWRAGAKEPFHHQMPELVWVFWGSLAGLLALGAVYRWSGVEFVAFDAAGQPVPAGQEPRPAGERPILVDLPCGGQVDLAKLDKDADEAVCTKGCRHPVLDLFERFVAAEEGGAGAAWKPSLGSYATALGFAAVLGLRFAFRSGDARIEPVGADRGLTLFGRSFGVIRAFERDWSSVEVFVILGGLAVLIWLAAAGLKRARDLNR